MKFVKFGIFALTMGLFVASCGDNNSTEGTENADSTAMMPAETAPATTDTAMAAPADTAMAAPADTAMNAAH